MENPEYQREPEANSSNEFHKICKVFIVLEGATLQLMYQPFETHYRGVVAFIIVILIYFSSLSAEFVLQTNGIRHVIVNKLSLFWGVLTVIMPIVITVPTIGGLALAMWVCVSGIVVCCSHVEIRRDFVDTYEDLMNRLRNGNANEQQPNGILDEIDGNANEQPNGMLDENQHEDPELPV